MAFKFVYDLTQAVPVFQTLSLTDSEAATKGEALILSSGKLTKAAAGGPVGYIAAQSVTAGTGNTCKVIPVTPTQVYEVVCTGTADGGFVLGVTTADIDSTGLLLNAADVTGGPCTLLEYDSTSKVCRVHFNNSYTAKA